MTRNEQRIATDKELRKGKVQKKKRKELMVEIKVCKKKMEEVNIRPRLSNVLEKHCPPSN